MVLIQQLFAHLRLKERLRRCFRHLTKTPIFGWPSIVLLLIVHALLGYRDLRHIRYYNDDPLVKRVLGLCRLPDVATISRALADADEQSVRGLRRLLGEMVLLRLTALCVGRVTLDFDGSVIGTSRYAEGTAVGFNRKKKRTTQLLSAVLHRSPDGPSGSICCTARVMSMIPMEQKAFISACISQVRAVLPRTLIEVRMDAAFFSATIVTMLEENGVDLYRQRAVRASGPNSSRSRKPVAAGTG